jgi:hypothetical protein
LILLAVREGIIACRLERFLFCKENSTALTVVKVYGTIHYSLAQRGFDDPVENKYVDERKLPNAEEF